LKGPFDGILGWGEDVLTLAVPAGILGTMVATHVRRLHDLNKSGYWVWLFTLVPLVAAPIVVAAALHMFSEDPAAGIFLGLFDEIGTNEVIIITTYGIVGLPFLVWGIVEMGFLRGHRGANRYGSEHAASFGRTHP
jgi:uncharacterized membrane protein YhaH (DUF805 family)